ncbi:membrane protein A32 [Aotine betaherpesvirus 1]|uniref:Membrane protein A32 n=1 Tax=Aotine betaherpesvirus 1 TaxID=50290 RepID=G8XUK6_9BETA|nr:membrane protein A32 [Aotine betaherpesvirus 1]AEV80848.1 membrane protein A32 [Aotine betaherpesvirus 1]
MKGVNWGAIIVSVGLVACSYANTTSTQTSTTPVNVSSTTNVTATPNGTTPTTYNVSTNSSHNATVTTVTTVTTAIPTNRSHTLDPPTVDLLYNQTVNYSECVRNHTWLHRPQISYCDRYDTVWMVLGREDRTTPSGRKVPLAYEGACCVVDGKPDYVFFIRHWYGYVEHHNALRVDYNCSWHTRLTPLYPFTTNFSVLTENYMATMSRFKHGRPCKGERVYYYGLQHSDELFINDVGGVDIRLRNDSFVWPHDIHRRLSGPLYAPSESPPIMLYLSEFLVLCGLGAMFLYLLLKLLVEVRTSCCLFLRSKRTQSYGEPPRTKRPSSKRSKW